MSARTQHPSGQSYLSTLLLALLLILAASLMLGWTRPADVDTSDPIRGEQIFKSVCATCHSVQPPANLAPPMAMIVRHYAMAVGNDGDIRSAVSDWLSEPDPAKSNLPGHAIERFGLMPRQELSDKDIADVIDYILTLDDTMSNRCMMRSDGAGRQVGEMHKMNQESGCMHQANERMPRDSSAMMQGVRRMDMGSRCSQMMQCSRTGERACQMAPPVDSSRTTGDNQ